MHQGKLSVRFHFSASLMGMALPTRSFAVPLQSHTRLLVMHIPAGDASDQPRALRATSTPTQTLLVGFLSFSQPSAELLCSALYSQWSKADGIVSHWGRSLTRVGWLALSPPALHISLRLFPPGISQRCQKCL